MKTEIQNDQAYVAPEMCIVNALIEGIICESGTGNISPWNPDPTPLGMNREF